MHNDSTPSAEHTMVCPNCGFHSSHNYCAQCGQETHLHKETFWALVLHFIGHYFHYDSKFWRTMKTLWLKPGELTLAYLRQQRMRFIPPISLYIFISAVFFIVAFSLPSTKQSHRAELHRLRVRADSIENAANNALPVQVSIDTESKGGFAGYVQKRKAELEKKHGKNAGEYVLAEVKHNFPKVFFFLIPILALFLKILFFRKTQFLFVHHAVFSLHIHSFLFSILLLSVINPFSAISSFLNFLIFITAFIYLVLALRKVYTVGYGKSVLITCLIGMGYLFTLLLAFIGVFVLALIE